MRKMTLHVAILGFLLAGAPGASSVAHGQVIGASWSSASGGTLNGTSFTFSGGSGVITTDLSGSNFTGYALSSNQQVVYYADSSTWTVNFSAPVTDLLLYNAGWRGGPTFTFSQSYTILAGNSGVTSTPTTLKTPGGFADYSNGVLKFSGAISSLSVTGVTSATGGLDALTFGVQTAAVPEASTYALASIAVAFGGAVHAFRRRRVRTV